MIARKQPLTCRHPNYTQTLPGICQAIRLFFPCYIISSACDSTRTLERNLLSLSTHVEPNEYYFIYQASQLKVKGLQDTRSYSLLKDVE